MPDFLIRIEDIGGIRRAGVILARARMLAGSGSARPYRYWHAPPPP